MKSPTRSAKTFETVTPLSVGGSSTSTSGGEQRQVRKSIKYIDAQRQARRSGLAIVPPRDGPMLDPNNIHGRDRPLFPDFVKGTPAPGADTARPPRPSTMDRSAKATKLKMIDDAKQLTREDKRNNYRRGSVVDRWRRASMFDEIVQAQSQDRASRSDNNRGEAARISQIQGAKSIGLSRDHRARMIAFEMAADHIRHHETKDTDEDTEWVGLNPFCVASMPEDIRRGFLTKVFGILFLQLFFTTVIVCVIKYSGLGEVLNATFWAVWIIFIMPYILVGVLLCVRKKHPVNLIVFTAFSVSIAFMLGLAIYGLADSLFIVTMGGMCAMVGGIAAFARKPMDDFNFYNSFYIVGLSVVLTLIISLSLYPGLLWHFYIWPPFATLLFGVWIIWDIVAIQIDLTPDEYIIGALDIYLDIINMILWMLVCCLYCLESVAKCAG